MEIKHLTEEILGQYMGLVATYYELHANPELSFAEYRTAEQIAARLRSEDIECRSIATTGVLAKIEGTAEGADLSKAVVLRADIDALPISEQSLSPHPSQNEGVMHACGHDMHATILLGTLALLNRHRDELGCTIFGLFQPGEELNPGGA
ncbi:MAG: M20/M25/M40 family metallo-hydrolase, partial [Tidjanibacter sp.]|nr:M20/M25/M40 family metallo-hydrolase [Tidjanibacter sp.]